MERTEVEKCLKLWAKLTSAVPDAAELLDLQDHYDMENMVSRLSKDDDALKKDLIRRCEPWNLEAYWARVRTFSTSTWFAKPYVLSAIECARFGWINTKTDLLSCPCCNACLSVRLPRGVSSKVFDETVAALRSSLSKGHNPLCPWLDNESPPRFSHHLVEGLSNMHHCVAKVQPPPSLADEGVKHLLQQAKVWIQKLLQETGENGQAPVDGRDRDQDQIPASPLQSFRNSMAPTLPSSASSVDASAVLLWLCRELRTKAGIKPNSQQTAESEVGASDEGKEAPGLVEDFVPEILLLCGWRAHNPSATAGAAVSVSCDLCHAPLRLDCAAASASQPPSTPTKQSTAAAAPKTPLQRAQEAARRARSASISTPTSSEFATPIQPSREESPSKRQRVESPSGFLEGTGASLAAGLNPLRSHAPWCPWIVSTTPDPLPGPATSGGLLLRTALARLGSSQKPYGDGKLDFEVLDAATVSALLCISKCVFGLRDVATLGLSLIEALGGRSSSSSAANGTGKEPSEERKDEGSQEGGTEAGDSHLLMLKALSQRRSKEGRHVPGWVATWLATVYSLLMDKTVYNLNRTD